MDSFGGLFSSGEFKAKRALEVLDKAKNELEPRVQEKRSPNFIKSCAQSEMRQWKS